MLMLDKKLQLNYGKILTALFSREALKKTIHKAFFTSVNDSIEKCYDKGDCQEFHDEMDSIGNNCFYETFVLKGGA